MKELYLRNCNNVFYQLMDQKRLYLDSENNNLIIFDPIGTTVRKIINSITNKPYDYLINELNTKRNLIVYWSAIKGATSDYIIYYNGEELYSKYPIIYTHGPDYKPVEFYLIRNALIRHIKLLNNSNPLNYKYVKYDNGAHSIIQFDQ